MEVNIKYTICFIRKGHEILLLNRQKSPWMGTWNGVGGKIEAGESPMDCVIREVEEETGIHALDVKFKGVVSWIVDNKRTGGMYVYVADIDHYEFPTPRSTREGILDWKDFAWIVHEENVGIANLHYYLQRIFQEDMVYDHQFVYHNREVTGFNSVPYIQSAFETSISS